MLSVIILAAGKGTRMRSSLPKTLHTICGEPMLFYILEVAFSISDDVHLVLHHQQERIKEAVSKRFKGVIFHAQIVEKYSGTGGAIMQEDKTPIPTQHERVLILNADMPLITKGALTPLLESKNNAIGLLHLADPKGYGRVILENHQVKKIVEEKDANDKEKTIKSVNAGVYFFERGFLEKYLPKLHDQNAQKEYYLTDLIALGIKGNEKIDAIFLEEERFLGVNSQTERAKAEEIMLERLRKNAMDSGVVMQLPDSIYLEKGVSFKGECVLEQGVRLSGNCLIEDAHIKAYSVIEESQIINSSVGPFAHVRPKSVICNSHVGNFVETKNAKLQGAKAGHLSYLGDCEIGKNTNVGAGVITCNYDGKKKHQTIIGENVFIGSDSQLVAPINIGSNVLIGSGTTITKDIPSGSLSLSRAPQTNIENGYFKFFKKS
ncbi:bifunctional UDP-N-acetylglucosamine diphosphorylase/glucosamine-1-phosphate N-acetyltransferase GlmU [Helicobacter pylori]|uniref:bifunctional UDP-N-acetylglucosamine diphosphorylase/glucosamine-1-phosphate N-acetyltransferase GlmU n=1 Tax=Helicobacter pylori TaxID=210 RepID=UPI00165A870F|nr:bifunctional UDP-N-acetylglucosamine diphosphorylase/glucosamine-1-phosphate N-acetyltransferase GlmU [Helicobacter pylori]MBH0260439.1 bifunctional UDP-N-acetylglucosamine diphosphorylase/glucosamine-1-phosphate N-acetyltransferase GlmU [Helicobacter pylori]MBH0261776.1 bifunctional UDP-N-acetylglucosamine diphosphorylase/glucosamine-1-phosphate N-acetyltransferase GlmU [Helicobacter pylori]